jgi:hypothetical protein
MPAVMGAVVLVLTGALSQAPASDVRMDRAAWTALRDAKFAVPEGRTAFEMLRAMTPLIASTDPFLRDNVAYEAAAKWIYADKLLSDAEQREILRAWTANLRQGVGEASGDAAFLRSFSALNLSIVAARENAAPFLTQGEFDAFVDAMTEYLAAERDTRGYLAGTGWVHATAHTAYALRFLARSPKLPLAGQARLLAAIDAECASFGEVFQWAEDERLAQIIVSIAARADFDAAAFDAWLATIPVRRKAVWANAPAIDPVKYVEVQNLTLVLRAAHATLSMASSLTPPLEAARASILATLRSMR